MTILPPRFLRARNNKPYALLPLIVLIAFGGFLFLYNGRLPGAVKALTQSAGPRTATSSSDCIGDASIGTVAWTNPGNAAATDGASATAVTGGTTSNYLKCTNFGFTATMISPGSTILGIIVTVTRQSNSTAQGGTADAAMRLVKGGTIGTTDRKTTTVYGTTLTSEDHGSSSDLWGATWTSSDITASNFGAALAVSKASGSGPTQTASVDSMTITVYFQPPPSMLTQRHFIFQNDDGASVDSNSNNGSADTALTNVHINERLVARIQVDNTGSGNFGAGPIQLQFDKNDNSWQNIGASTEISISPGLSGSSGDALTSNAAGACTTGTTFTNGSWIKSASSVNVLIATSSCTELGFVVSTARATNGTTYRLRLYNSFENKTLDTYSVYPTLTIIGAASETIRASKNSVVAMPACAATGWGCQTIDTSTATGKYSRMTIDSTGTPWIVYEDTTAQTVKVAKFVSSGGTGCGNSRWTCTVVASVGTATANLGIALDASGNPWITYLDFGAKIAYTAKYVGAGGSGCTSTAWTCMALETNGGQSGDSSITIDPSGTAWAGYLVNQNSFHVAKYVGSGGSGCTSTAWTCTIVDSVSSNGAGNQIRSDNNGTIWASYYDATNKALRVTKFVSSGGTGCTSTAWTCTSVDVGGAGQVGEYTSIAFDSSNNPWASYYDRGNGDLKVAKFVTANGTGCTSTAWACTAVDSTNNVGLYTGIALDSNNVPSISYYDGTNLDMRVASYVGSGGTGCATSTWNCTSIDTGGDVGQFISIAIGSDGTIWTAYSDTTNSQLKAAKVMTSTTTVMAAYSLDNVGYTAIGSTGGPSDSMAAGSDLPLYRVDLVSQNNTSNIALTWSGQSTVAASTSNIKLEIYRYGTTNAWVSLATNSTCAANSACAISPSTISTNLSEYYQSSGSVYLVHIRLSQAASSSETLTTDVLGPSGAPTPTPTPSTPTNDQILRHGEWFLNGIRQPFSFKK